MPDKNKPRLLTPDEYESLRSKYTDDQPEETTGQPRTYRGRLALGGGLLTRVLAGIASGVVGAVPTPVTTPAAAAIGGAGEALAQKIESPDPIDLSTVGVEAGLSAIPLSKIYKALKMGKDAMPIGKQILANVGRGAVMTEAGNVARRYNSEGNILPQTPTEAVWDIGSSAIGGLFGLAGRKAANAKIAEQEALDAANVKRDSVDDLVDTLANRSDIVVPTPPKTPVVPGVSNPDLVRPWETATPVAPGRAPQRGLTVGAPTHAYRDASTINQLESIPIERGGRLRGVSVSEPAQPSPFREGMERALDEKVSLRPENLDKKGNVITKEGAEKNAIFEAKRLAKQQERIIKHARQVKEEADAEEARKLAAGMKVNAAQDKAEGLVAKETREVNVAEQRAAEMQAKAQHEAAVAQQRAAELRAKEGMAAAAAQQKAGDLLAKEGNAANKAQVEADTLLGREGTAANKAQEQAISEKDKIARDAAIAQQRAEELRVKEAESQAKAIDERIAQDKIDEQLKEMEPGDPVITETTTNVRVPGGKQTLRQSFTKPKPDAEDFGDDVPTQVGPKPGKPTPAAKPDIPVTDPDVVAKTTYPSQQAALHAIAGSGKRGVPTKMGHGKWRVVFEGNEAKPLPPVDAAVKPVDEPTIPGKGGVAADVPKPVVGAASPVPDASTTPPDITPPQTPPPAAGAIPVTAKPKPKGPAGGASLKPAAPDTDQPVNAKLIIASKGKDGKVTVIVGDSEQDLSSIYTGWKNSGGIYTRLGRGKATTKMTVGELKERTAKQFGVNADEIHYVNRNKPAGKPSGTQSAKPSDNPVTPGKGGVATADDKPRGQAPTESTKPAGEPKMTEADVAAELDTWGTVQLRHALTSTKSPAMRKSIEEAIKRRQGPDTPPTGAVPVIDKPKPTNPNAGGKLVKPVTPAAKASGPFTIRQTINGKDTVIEYDKETNRFYLTVDGKVYNDGFYSRAAAEEYVRGNNNTRALPNPIDQSKLPKSEAPKPVTPQIDAPAGSTPLGMKTNPKVPETPKVDIAASYPKGTKIKAYGSEGEVLTVAPTGVRVKFTSGRMAKEQGAKGYFDVDPNHIEDSVPIRDPNTGNAVVAPKAEPVKPTYGDKLQKTADTAANKVDDATKAASEQPAGLRKVFGEEYSEGHANARANGLKDDGWTNVIVKEGEKKRGGPTWEIHGVPPPRKTGTLGKGVDVDITKAKSADDVKRSVVAALKQELKDTKDIAAVSVNDGAISINGKTVAHVVGRRGSDPELRFSEGFEAAAGKGELPTLKDVEGTRAEITKVAADRVRGWWLKNYAGAEVTEVRLPNGFSIKIPKDNPTIRAAIQRIEQSDPSDWSGIVDKNKIKLPEPTPTDGGKLEWPWGKPGSKSKYTADQVTSPAFMNQEEVLGKVRALAQQHKLGDTDAKPVTITLSDSGFEMTVAPHQAEELLKRLEKEPMSTWAVKAEPPKNVSIPVNHGISFGAKSETGHAPGFKLPVEGLRVAGKPAAKPTAAKSTAKEGPAKTPSATPAGPLDEKKAKTQAFKDKYEADMRERNAKMQVLADRVEKEGGLKAVDPKTGRTILLHPSLDKDSKWRVTYFDKDGQPTGHTEYTKLGHEEKTSPLDSALSEFLQPNYKLSDLPEVTKPTMKPTAPIADIPKGEPVPLAEVSGIAAAQKAFDEADAAYGKMKDKVRAGEATTADLRAAGDVYGKAKSALNKAIKEAEDTGAPVPTFARTPDKRKPAGTGPTNEDIAAMPPDEQEAALKDVVAKFRQLKGKKGDTRASVTDSPARTTIDDETGASANELLLRAGLTTAGAAYGATQTPDDPIVGAVLGGGAGFGAGYFAPAAFRAIADRLADSSERTRKVAADSVWDKMMTLKEMMPDYYRASVLSKPDNLFINMAVGPWGSAVMGSIEAGLSGDSRGWKALKELSPLNFGKEYRLSWEEARERLGDATERVEHIGKVGPDWFKHGTSMPAHLLLAGDVAGRRILMNAGFTEAEARSFNLTGEPFATLNKAMGNAVKTKGPHGHNSWALRMMLPFYRTNANQLEQNILRIPVFGSLARKYWAQAPVSLRTEVVQQATTLGMGGTAYAMGATFDEKYDKLSIKFLSNFGGVYGTTTALAYMAGASAKKGNPKGKQLSDAITGFLQRDMPLPSADIFFSMSKAFFALTDDNPNTNPTLPYGLVPPLLSSKQYVSAPTLVRDPEGFFTGTARPTEKEFDYGSGAKLKAPTKSKTASQRALDKQRLRMKQIRDRQKRPE